MRKKLELTYKDKMNLYENRENNASNYKLYRNIRWIPRILFPASWLVMCALNSFTTPILLMTLPLFIVMSECIAGAVRLAVDGAIKQNTDGKIGYRNYKKLAKNGQLREAIDEVEFNMIFQNSKENQEKENHGESVELNREMTRKSYDKSSFIFDEKDGGNKFKDDGREA